MSIVLASLSRVCSHFLWPQVYLSSRFAFFFVCVFSVGLKVLNKAWLSIVLFCRYAHIYHSALLSTVSLQYLPLSSTLHSACLSPLLVPDFSLTISFSMSLRTPFFQVSYFYICLLSACQGNLFLSLTLSPTCASLCFGSYKNDQSLAKASMNNIVVDMGSGQGRVAGVAEQTEVPIPQVRSTENSYLFRGISQNHDSHSNTSCRPFVSFPAFLPPPPPPFFKCNPFT
jgi:hypothetical protein